MDDQVLTAVNELKKKVDDLSLKVGALEKKWQWIMSAAMLLVGAVGGPNAVSLITGGKG